MRRTPMLLAVSALTGVLAVTAGAVALRADAPDPAADRAALAKNLNPERRGVDYARGFDHLIEMLPNATHGGSGQTYSDSVVVGTITEVAEHTGVIDVVPAPEAGMPDFTNQTVPFDSPLAHWRNLKVTVAVADTLAGEQVKTLVLDWPVMGSTAKGEDAAAISRALKSLGSVMVTTKAVVASTIGQARRLTDPTTGLAQVATDGTLSFPIIGGEGGSAISVARAEAAFTNGVDTVAEVRDAASKPTWKAPQPSWSSAG